MTLKDKLINLWNRAVGICVLIAAFLVIAAFIVGAWYLSRVRFVFSP